MIFITSTSFGSVVQPTVSEFNSQFQPRLEPGGINVLTSEIKPRGRVRFLTNGNFYSSVYEADAARKFARIPPSEIETSISFPDLDSVAFYIWNANCKCSRNNRASAFPSTKSRVRSRLESSSSNLFRFRACSKNHRERKLVPLTFTLHLLLSSSSCELRVPSFRQRKLDATNGKQQRERSDGRRQRCRSYKQYGNKDDVAYGIIMVIH